MRTLVSTILAVHSLAAGAGIAAAAPVQGQALADAYIACWGHFNARNWDKFSACYGPSSVSISPGQPEARGATAIVERQAKPFAEAFPDVSGALQTVLVNGNRLMSLAILTGTQKAPLKTPAGEIPATGKTFGQLIAHGVESNAHSVAAKEWLIQDGGTLMAQLGLSPAPARAPIPKAAPAAPQLVVATGSATEKQNLGLAKRFYVAFNRRDAGKSADLLADDIVDRNQTLPRDVAGKNAVMELASGLWQMSSNVKFDARTLWAAGDYVVAVGFVGGTNDGDMPAFGITKTGKKFRVDIVEISRWENGKMKELWPLFNGAQLAGQLGLLPPQPGSANGPAGHAPPVARKP